MTTVIGIGELESTTNYRIPPIAGAIHRAARNPIPRGECYLYGDYYK
jgi:hypothetical protein